MSKKTKITSEEEEMTGTEEMISSEGKTTENYEVGYGKPPKDTQFKKGASGNPNGRPKDSPDFDDALLREVKSRVTITENGKRIRVSKHDIIVKQFVNSAMKGKGSDLRMFREAYRQACEKDALSAGANPLYGKRAHDYSDDELLAIYLAELEKQKKE